MTVAALQRLAINGEVKSAKVAKALAELEIDPDKLNPYTD